ncbi:hypothetical protein QBC33DRAFT_171859 [Phialemonium atrogriseum]|uniref:Stress-response A/B barrel domain-containing protein n=1 Tax=Phialemonium atrogriseum TaxID=1093897 RepID=A0AAJ0FR29_9PEZI|nr:uncharacterized protein QBC33DRAFT_171859 [Phialemonium atrogriseum]KAK1771959.1 hypothetical protein QBC33DRAFT_171859 [Phialemonium atrogriseum]
MARSQNIVASVLIFLTLFLIASLSTSNDYVSFRAAPTTTTTVTHTVLFQFKADANPEHVHAACARFLSLKDACIHPTTQTPYITSLQGGKDNSAEGRQNGITHGFIVEFASAEDRDYYVGTDPIHQAFVKSLDGLVEKAIVIDFRNGVY